MQKDLQRDVAFVVNDIHNLPVSVWKASTGQELKYYYDTDGKRIRKDAGLTEYYVNGVGGETEAIVKSDESGATHSILGHDNLGQVKRSGSSFARYYYLKDHLGTIKMNVDASCNTTGYDDYYPFGQQMDGRCYTSSADARYKYTSKERDAESGYDYFGARSAGLPSSISFHSLRHTFASWLAALGTDFKTLQELIGHRSNEATQIYVHAFDPNKRSAIEKLILPRKAINE